jgi:hypothetical protein
MTIEQLSKLRNGNRLKLFDKKNKLFTTIQLNKKDDRICWERWVSKDRINWVNHNMYLSLKDIKQITTSISENLKTI